MGFRFLMIRTAAGALAMGAAAPVNLPFVMHAMHMASAEGGDAAASPNAQALVRRGQAAFAEAGNARGTRLLTIGANGEIPCDSGDWATSDLFGPHAGLMAALGVKPTGIGNGMRDLALADALDGRPTGGNADSSAFGSVFGNAGPSTGGGPGGGLFTPPGNGNNGVGGGPVVGGGTTGGTGGGTDSGKGGGTTDGGGTSTCGTGTNGGTGGPTGPGKGGTGSTGGTGNTGNGGTTGGTGSTGNGGSSGGSGTGGDGGNAAPGGTNSTGSGGGTSGTGSNGGTGSTGGNGGLVAPPIDTIAPPNPDLGDPSNHESGGGSTGDVGAVPEPASWMTMLAGFGLIGGMMRSRPRKNRACLTS